MKKILLGSALLAILASQAMASGIYVAGKVGGSNGEANSIHPEEHYISPLPFPSITDTSFTNNVVAWGGAVGYEYNKWIIPLRMEAEYLYRNHYDYETKFAYDPSGTTALFSSTVDTQTILANFYMDFPITKMFGLFIGGGLGEAINTTQMKLGGTNFAGSDLKGSMDNVAFSWMTTAGLTVKPLKWLAFDLSYRYSDLGDISWRIGQANGNQAEFETDSFAAQEIYLGIRMLIPNMYNKPHAKKAHHQYIDK